MTVAIPDPKGADAQERLIHHQEVLIAELNHRARNALHLISNLIDQSASTATSVHDFAQTVNARVKAMARAHDLITRKNWDLITFRELLGVETAAFDTSAGRLVLRGHDVGIHPEACTTLALVLHELVTNAVKYGAFACPDGKLVITLSQNAQADLMIDWHEQGVHLPALPSHEGFGSTIINGSIPYELGGTAETTFTPTGLRGLFVIPSRHLDDSDQQNTPEANHEHCNHQTAGTPLSGTALLVEDSMLMAMGAEQHLQQLGAEAVLICQDINTALEAIAADADIRLCLLDVNLDGEYSIPIAKELAARDIP